jgi:hypothetical protein
MLLSSLNTDSLNTHHLRGRATVHVLARGTLLNDKCKTKRIRGGENSSEPLDASSATSGTLAFIVADTLERTKNAAEAGAHDISSRRAVENIAAS